MCRHETSIRWDSQVCCPHYTGFAPNDGDHAFYARLLGQKTPAAPKTRNLFGPTADYQAGGSMNMSGPRLTAHPRRCEASRVNADRRKRPSRDARALLEDGQGRRVEVPYLPDARMDSRWPGIVDGVQGRRLGRADNGGGRIRANDAAHLQQLLLRLSLRVAPNREGSEGTT